MIINLLINLKNLFIKDFKYSFLSLNVFNKYFIFANFSYFFNRVFLKKFFYDYYKENKFDNHVILSTSFFLVALYIFDIKGNINFILKNIYIKIGSEKLSSINIIYSVIWISFTVLLSLYNSIVFEFLFQDIELELNLRILLFKCFSCFLFFVILITGFTFMKLDNLILGIIGTSFTLGFSISVQKIITNYISGLIILTDDSFKLGDAININGYQGVLSQVTSRHVILRNLDCSEILIPNEKFINDVVQNQSLFFSKGNLRINIQVSYNNNIKLVLKLLTDSTKNVERVLDNPIPLSYFTNFNSEGIELELSFWIIDALRGAALVRSSVNLNIYENFFNNKIELSYNKKYIKVIN